MTRREVWTLIAQLTPGFLGWVQDSAVDHEIGPEDVGEAVQTMYRSASERIHGHLDGLSRVDISPFGLASTQRAVLSCAMRKLPVNVLE